MKSNKKSIIRSIALTEKLFKLLTKKAEEEEISLSALVRKIIKKFLQKQEVKK